ncbi:auxin response factor 5 isoform X2 [Prunus yedoensis var. nudiflora]|uniref:Auxin response factor 5 isoform X2 n=1 Tax=Prunus yedoensis var. nudiflora TaxID=2094558 RepID=A0A314Y0T6_PRUYE|nr:auxin response factor 5 isoform X2 [Prunus yedoensis var. nudiflora]
MIECSRYMGTIVGISDLDPLRWPGSKWRNLQQSAANGDLIADMKTMQAKLNQKNLGVFSKGQGIEDKLAAGFVSPYNLVNQLTFANQNQSTAQLQTSPRLRQPPLESLLYHSQQTDMPHSDFNSTNGSLPFLDNDECIFYQSCQPIAGTLTSPGPLFVLGLQDSSAVLTEANNSSLTSIGQEMWDNSLNNCRLLPHVDQLTSSHRDLGSLNCISNSSSLRDLSDESNNQNGIYGCPNVDVGSGVSTVIDPSVSSTILDEFSTLENADFHQIAWLVT